MFSTRIDEILEQVACIDPVRYGRTRNFLTGSVTRLSPFISRGVISTRRVMDAVLSKGHRFHEIERLLMELAWRDYFQNVWLTKNIDEEIKQPQSDVRNTSMPKAVLEARTGIKAVDDAISGLYETGYIHNHSRMYIASITCNVAKCHWSMPAKWFYYHLLDADWASNACSWQWVSGTFSNKKYYANQDNINKYCGTDQHGTFLDIDYSEFPGLEIPNVLRETESPVLKTVLPRPGKVLIDSSLPTLIYNFYNLDPFWKPNIRANRVLLLEPSHFDRYPVSQRSIDFILRLSENIDGLQVFTGEFSELKAKCELSEIHYKEHPTVAHYSGLKDERDWMFSEIRGYFPSFFSYWKKCERVIKRNL